MVKDAETGSFLWKTPLYTINCQCGATIVTPARFVMFAHVSRLFRLFVIPSLLLSVLLIGIQLARGNDGKFTILLVGLFLAGYLAFLFGGPWGYLQALRKKSQFTWADVIGFLLIILAWFFLFVLTSSMIPR